MKIVRIDHIAICVPELEPALAQWQAILGLVAGPREYIPNQATDVAFVLTPAEGEACVEFITPQPRGKNAGLEKFLDGSKGRGGLHHIAFAVADLAGALAELDGRGVPLIDRQPRPGARGHQVAFLHPRAFAGVLVELVSA